MIRSGVSLFFLKNSTHVYLEKSSTITSMYFFPEKLSVLMGPHKSMCKSSKFCVIEDSEIDLCELLLDFPISQASQILSFLEDIKGNPFTKPLLASLFRFLKFNWANLLCHNQLLPLLIFENKHNFGCSFSSLKSK
ncbi:hypothetical protein HanIR_Chr12g0610831 [Helianthus annuus]|nr:hypothetical protein HanIR_Chr12g0610831 [Helianthus annuus]